MGLLVFYLFHHKNQIEIISSVASGSIIFSFIIGFISLGIRKKSISMRNLLKVQKMVLMLLSELFPT